MTEEEANTKTCHKTLAPLVQPDGNITFYSSSCIGSACMAWRSQPARKVRLSPIEDEVETPAESWCGLAGKP